MRGIDPASFGVRDEAQLVEGRMLRFGTNEVVVGRAAARSYAGLDGRLRDQGRAELVDGGRHVRVARQRRRDGNLVRRAVPPGRVPARQHAFSRCCARLESPPTYGQFKDWLTTNPQLNVSVRPEPEYYMAQSVTLTRLIRSVGFAIALLMGIGAVFGAILTMYTAVSTRTREIATLRALGFNTASVLVSVLAESLALRRSAARWAG